MLADRLARLGFSGGVSVHENRTVLASVTRRGVLRVHRGFAYATDRVLEAVVVFADLTAGRAARRDAERVIVAFPVEEYVRPAVSRRRRRQKLEPGDRRHLAALRRLHERLNHERFGGELSPIRFRLSGRMRRRLGEVTVDPVTNQAVEIAISRNHLLRDGWKEVEHTVLHEMVHQWQAEAGHEIDHGPTFRRKAVAVGAVPRADRVVTATDCHS